MTAVRSDLTIEDLAILRDLLNAAAPILAAKGEPPPLIAQSQQAVHLWFGERPWYGDGRGRMPGFTRCINFFCGH